MMLSETGNSTLSVTLQPCTSVECTTPDPQPSIDCRPTITDPHVDHLYYCHTHSTPPLSRVSLMSSSGEVVGIASIVDGTLLHGRALPSGYIKVIIDQVQPGILPHPLLATPFDEPLASGQFTAWPMNCLKPA